MKITTENKIWFTSDIHFGHKSILDFCPNRKSKYGETVEQMNQSIISDWNNSVSKEDVVFILGDVSFASITETAKLISELNGKLHLVYGNHCKKFLDKKLFTVWFETISPYLDLQIDDQKLVLCHYPIYEWNACHWGAWHLHGHTHGKKLPMHNCKCLDVGLDSTNKTVIDFETIKDYMKTKPNLSHGSGEQGI